MASSLLDVCRFTPTLGGTTDWTYSAAVTGYQSPTAAGVVSAAIYSYRAESADLTQWEIGTGAYSAGVFSRTTVLFNSSGTTAKISFTTVPQVAIVALAEDLNNFVSSGFVNKFRNGTMDVWQRGTASMTVTTSGAYTADGWIVLPTGASVAVAQAAGRSLTANSLQVTGATSVTDVVIKQRIESNIASPFNSQTVTVQAWVRNDTGASITPTLTVKHATAVDNWGATSTDIAAVSLQACANAAWTQVVYTLTASASSGNGLEVGFDFGNNFSTNGKSIKVTELDIRVSPGISTGLNSNPPQPELKPIQTELAFCQRYLNVYNSVTAVQTVLAFGGSYTTTNMFCFWWFPVAMRVAPTGMTVSSAAHFMGASGTGIGITTTSVTFGGAAVSGVEILGAVAAGLTAGQWSALLSQSASAQLLFTGAEL